MWEIEASIEMLRTVSGSDVGTALLLHLPRLVHAGVHTAPTGLIQDPAGLAIGDERPPHHVGAGGASRAIYATFPDLEPIPELSVGSSVLNRATGAGARVLHTHAPVLTGDPSSHDDVVRVLRQLTDVYERAIEVGLAATPEAIGTGLDINLVPVSGRIFAGLFRDPALDHLHPSYTITAVLGSLARRLALHAPLPRTTLWVFDAVVFEAAEQSVEAWRTTLQ